jgi:hypothetical protein
MGQDCSSAISKKSVFVEWWLSEEYAWENKMSAACADVGTYQRNTSLELIKTL